ncbi:MAG: CopD family protein [Granulosicoccus sp.]
MNAIAITVHGLLATIWIGGMFFAYIVLRPTVASLEPHRRLTLFDGVFKRFFPWVWMAVLFLPVTGYWLIFNAFGGFAESPVYVHIMHLMGLIMIVLFVYLFYVPYRKLKTEVAREAWSEAGTALNQVRQIVLVNLILGLILLAVVYAGRYGFFT